MGDEGAGGPPPAAWRGAIGTAAAAGGVDESRRRW